MNTEFSSVLVFVLGLLYLIMLPGYIVLAGTKMDNFDIIEKLTASFGIGIGVLTMISIVLSMPSSLGLTATNLALANAAVLVILFAWFFLKYRQNKRVDKPQGYERDKNAFR
ncbi:MAG: hypothetical protein ACXV5H_02065 [Halobacteriota archaeon]